MFILIVNNRSKTIHLLIWNRIGYFDYCLNIYIHTCYNNLIIDQKNITIENSMSFDVKHY